MNLSVPRKDPKLAGLKIKKTVAKNKPGAPELLTGGLNQTHVPYPTRWTHKDLETPVIIEPKTAMESIVQKLEQALNKKTHYTRRQKMELKQLYNNKQYTSDRKSVRRRSAHGWSVEYFKDGVYTSTIEPVKKKTGFEKSLDVLSRKMVWTHELYPVVNQVTVGPVDNFAEIAKLLNETVEHININLDQIPITLSDSEKESLTIIIENKTEHLNQVQNLKEILEKIYKKYQILQTIYRQKKTDGIKVNNETCQFYRWMVCTIYLKLGLENLIGELHVVLLFAYDRREQTIRLHEATLL